MEIVFSYQRHLSEIFGHRERVTLDVENLINMFVYLFCFAFRKNNLKGVVFLILNINQNKSNALVIKYQTVMHYICNGKYI